MNLDEKKMLIRLPFELHKWFKGHCVSKSVTLQDMIIKMIYDLKKDDEKN